MSVQQWKEVQTLLWKMTGLALEDDHALRTGPNKALAVGGAKNRAPLKRQRSERLRRDSPEDIDETTIYSSCG
jgi:hypothetical protein